MSTLLTSSQAEPADLTPHQDVAQNVAHVHNFVSFSRDVGNIDIRKEHHDEHPIKQGIRPVTA